MGRLKEGATRESKQHIKKTHIKNFRESQGGGPGGGGGSGSEFFMLVTFFPSKIQCIRNVGGGVQGVEGGGSKVQFLGSFLYVYVLFRDLSNDICVATGMRVQCRTDPQCTGKRLSHGIWSSFNKEWDDAFV